MPPLPPCPAAFKSLLAGLQLAELEVEFIPDPDGEPEPTYRARLTSASFAGHPDPAEWVWEHLARHPLYAPVQVTAITCEPR